MNNSRPLVMLGEVLKPVSRPESIDPEKTYKILGAHWYAKGLYIKDVLPGSEIRADKAYRVEEGDFVYNRLFAWKGSFAVATKEDYGCYVSNEFPCFAVNRDRVDPIYLWKYFSRNSAWDEALGLSTGGTPTSRNRLKEEKFLALKIPLSPLPEQRRIVARIEELADKIDEARGLRQKTTEEVSVLVSSALADIFRKLGTEHDKKKIDDLCEVVRGGSPRPAGSPVYYGGNIPFMKVGDLTKDEGKYVYDASASVNELGRQQSRYIEAETLMLTNSGATLGVPKITKIASCFNDGSQAFLNLSPNVDKEFLFYFFKSKTGWFRDQLARGQGQPNLNTDMTKQMEVPLPPLSNQRRLVAELDALQDQANVLKKLQAATAAELEALLPSILDKAFKGEL